jgi:hypothetical protein
VNFQPEDAVDTGGVEESRARIDLILRKVASGARPFLVARLGEFDPSKEVPGPDPAQVLAVFGREWHGVARGWFGHSWRTVRGHVGEMHDIRNRFAHPDGDDFSAADVQRAEDTARRLLVALRDAEYTEHWSAPPSRRPSEEERRAAADALVGLGSSSAPQPKGDADPFEPPDARERTRYVDAREEAQAIHDPREAVARAKLLRGEGRLVEALAVNLRAVELDRRNIYALNSLAGCLRALGRLSDAERYARTSLDVSAAPSNAPARVTLASILADYGSTEALIEARALCQQVLAFQAGNTHARNALARIEQLASASGITLTDGSDTAPVEDDDIPF